MSKVVSPQRRLLLRSRTVRSGLAIAMAIAMLPGLASRARADQAYGFSIQGVNNLRLAAGGGASLVGTSATVDTSDFAAVNGTMDQHVDTILDLPQAWVGPHPGENFYGVNIPAGGGVPAPGVNVTPPYSWLNVAGTTGSNGGASVSFPSPTFPLSGVEDGLAPGTMPIGPPANFARGDLLVTGPLGNLFSTGIFGVGVAESFIGASSPLTSQANATWIVTANFTAIGNGTLAVLADYTNSVYSATLGPNAHASSDYGVDYTLTDLNTLVDQHYSPLEMNHTHTSPVNIAEHINNGNADQLPPNLFTLIDGHSYQIQMSFQTHTLLAVPEPSSVALLGLGILGSLGWSIRRRRRVPVA